MVDKAKTKPASFRKRMIWMLSATLLIFGGVFGLKAVMGKGMNEFFDNMPQPASAVTAYTARQEEWTDAQESVGTFVAINGTDVTTESAGVVKRLLFDPGGVLTPAPPSYRSKLAGCSSPNRPKAQHQQALPVVDDSLGRRPQSNAAAPAGGSSPRGPRRRSRRPPRLAGVWVASSWRERPERARAGA